MNQNLSDWFEAGRQATVPLTVAEWTNAEIGAALKTFNIQVHESFASSEDIAKAVKKTSDLSLLLTEYRARLISQKSLSGVQQVFAKNVAVRVAPGELSIVKDDKVVAVPTYGVGYFSEHQSEAVSYAASGAIVARTYGHKGHIIATHGYPMPPVVREEHKNSSNPILKKMTESILQGAEAYTQRDKVAQMMVKSGGYLPVCALFSNMKPGKFIPTREAPEEVLKIYKSLNLSGQYMYALCAPPKYTPMEKSDMAKAATVRSMCRAQRGENNGQVSSLCAPSYIGEFPRPMQTSLTTAFSFLMVARLIDSDMTMLLDFSRYKMSSDVEKLLAGVVPLWDDVSKDPYDGTGRPGRYYLPTEVGPNKKISFYSDNYPEPTVTKGKVIQPDGVVRHIDSLVLMMKRDPSIVLVDTFAYSHLFERKDVVLVPHPIGHRCRIFIALASKLTINSVHESEYANYTVHCNLWRSYYPFHRTPLWSNKGYMMYFKTPPAITIRRQVKNKDPVFLDVGIIAADDANDDAYYEQLRSIPTKIEPPVVSLDAQVVSSSINVEEQQGASLDYVPQPDESSQSNVQESLIDQVASMFENNTFWQ